MRVQRRRPAEVDGRRRRDGRERAARRRRLVVGAGARAAAADRLVRRRGGARRRQRRRGRLVAGGGRHRADVLVGRGGVPARRGANPRHPLVAARRGRRRQRRRVASGSGGGGGRRRRRRLRVHGVRPFSLLGRAAAHAAAAAAAVRRSADALGWVARRLPVDHLELLFGAVVVVGEITVAGHRRVQEVRRRGRRHHARYLAVAAAATHAAAVAADAVAVAGHAVRRTIALFMVHNSYICGKRHTTIRISVNGAACVWW